MYQCKCWRLLTFRLSDQLSATSEMFKSNLALEAIRRLSLLGFTAPHRSPECKEIWQYSWRHVEMFVRLFNERKLSNQQKDFIKCHLEHWGKLFTVVAHSKPASFGLMPETPILVSNYWNLCKEMRDRQASMGRTTEKDTEIFETFNLTALLLLRKCFAIVYDPKHTSNVSGEDCANAKELIKREVLSDETLLEVFRGIVSKFFVALPSDCEILLSEPEEWELKEEGDEGAPDVSVRPCAERLLLDITLRNKPIVGGWLVEFSHEVKGKRSGVPPEIIHLALG